MRIKYIFLSTVFCLSFHAVLACSSSLIASDDSWEQEFRLDREPSTYSENWKLHRWGGPVSVLTKGWLRLASFSTIHGEEAGVIWRFTNRDGQPKMWNGNQPSTVEFRVEVSTRNNVKYGSTFTVSDDTNYYQFKLPAASMATYRIELDDGKAKLFRKGTDLVLQENQGTRLSLDAENRNFIYFGDSGIGVDGTSTWEFVRWTNRELLPKKSNLKKSGFGFERKLDFSMFPDDARQWEEYENSVMLTDLSISQPASSLVDGQRENGKWKVLPFKTDDIEGTLLSVYPRTDAQPIKLPLTVTKGKYAIYIGLSTAPSFHSSERSGIKVKLNTEPDFRNLYNDMDWLDHKRDVIQESFYIVADLEANDVLEIGQIPNLPAVVAYVRLVPVKKQEYTAYNNDQANRLFKNNIGTIDGHGMLLYNQARSASDIRGHFRMFENSDYGKWWYQVLGADLVNYPSKVGTLAGAGNKDFPRWYDEEFVASVEGLVANGVNTLTVSRQMAKEQGNEFHVMLRPQGWAAAMPFEETFNSKFYYNHPQWRAVDEYGVPTMYMSYAVPEVRKQLLAVIEETVVLSDPDGVGILFNRGMPLMLWEEAFAQAFEQKYLIKLKDVPFSDSRIATLRAEIMTILLVDLRNLLDKIGKERQNKRYKISIAVLDQRQNNLHGIAVEQWIKNGLIDEIAIPAGDTKLYEQISNEYEIPMYPLITPWDNYKKPGDFAKQITSFYDNHANGIVVWDGDMEPYKKATEPHAAHMLRYIGHKELINYWSETRLPRPNTFRITKMGDNEYSGWMPNTGF